MVNYDDQAPILARPNTDAMEHPVRFQYQRLAHGICWHVSTITPSTTSLYYTTVSLTDVCRVPDEFDDDTDDEEDIDDWNLSACNSQYTSEWCETQYQARSRRLCEVHRRLDSSTAPNQKATGSVLRRLQEPIRQLWQCTTGSGCVTGMVDVSVDCPTSIPHGEPTYLAGSVPIITYTCTNMTGFYKVMSEKHGIPQSWLTWG